MSDERLSEPARQALDRAHAEAQALGHDRVEAEHILLGLLGDDDGAAVRVLARLGADPQAIRSELVRTLGVGAIDDLPTDRAAPAATPPSFTAWLGAALTAASAEAMADGRSIEVTDFLLALAQDPQSPAGWVLAELGVDAPSLRATAEHLRLLDREIGRVGREMHDAAAAEHLDLAAELRDQRRLLIAQRQRKAGPSKPDPPAES
jgi:ATP-dependent Clp protease ATP-binding subunit ClpA